MTSLILTSFTNEAKAVNASHKLIELESFGDISVFEKALIKKDASGDISILQSETSDGTRTFSGLAIGSLIGVFGGPVGILLGMIAGITTGAILDANHEDFSESFVSKVTDRLQPGTVALVAEISEDNPGLLDSVFKSYGTTVHRSNVDYEYDEFKDSELEEMDSEIAGERAKIKTAVSSDKLKIQQKIAQLKQRRHQRITSLKEKNKSGLAKFKMSIKEDKKARLRGRIHKHQARIAELQDQLKKLEN